LTYSIEFLYDGIPVGVLLSRPKKAGMVKYEPYRSFGHYEMQEALKNAITVECILVKKKLKQRKKINQSTWFFKVISCPEYGVLEISDLYKEI